MQNNEESSVTGYVTIKDDTIRQAGYGDEPAQDLPGSCASCRHACAAFAPDLNRWGVPLDSRVPALVRQCTLETGHAGVQLTNSFWSCPMWEGAA